MCCVHIFSGANLFQVSWHNNQTASGAERSKAVSRLDNQDDDDDDDESEAKKEKLVADSGCGQSSRPHAASFQLMVALRFGECAIKTVRLCPKEQKLSASSRYSREFFHALFSSVGEATTKSSRLRRRRRRSGHVLLLATSCCRIRLLFVTVIALYSLLSTLYLFQILEGNCPATLYHIINQK